MSSAGEAVRRFEFSVHGAVPERPATMYQSDTHGQVPTRNTGEAAGDALVPSTAAVDLFARFIIRDGTLVIEGPREL